MAIAQRYRWPLLDLVRYVDGPGEERAAALRPSQLAELSRSAAHPVRLEPGGGLPLARTGTDEVDDPMGG